MLFVLTGSTCSGKSTLARAIGSHLGDAVAIHDFDELGVPRGGGKAWRQRATETWIVRALEYEDQGIDLLLAGQSPLGEWLAAPSAPMLNGLAVCLVDAPDDVRLERLRGRGPQPPELERAVLGWAEWHRRHALDPQYRPHVLREDGWEEMRWDRWADWRAGDPRWAVPVVDNGRRKVEDAVAEVERWIRWYNKQALPPF